MDPDEIKEIFDDQRLIAYVVLQAMLAAHRHACVNHFFKAADYVERAIYALRDSDLDKLLESLQVAARKRIAPPSLGSSGQ